MDKFEKMLRDTIKETLKETFPELTDDEAEECTIDLRDAMYEDIVRDLKKYYEQKA